MTLFQALRITGCLALMSLFAAEAAANGTSPPLDLDVHAGQVVIVDFWASWCVPCRRSFPWLESMQRKYAEQGLVIIAVNEDADADEAEAFLRDYPVSFRIVRDREGKLAREFDLVAMPSSYVFARDGSVAARHLGFKTAKQDEYEETLRRLLRDAPTAAGPRAE